MRNSIADAGQQTHGQDMQLPCLKQSSKSVSVNVECGCSPGGAGIVRD